MFKDWALLEHDNELFLSGQVRSDIASLCSTGEYLAAYLRLKDSELAPETDPGPWEYLARMCMDAGLGQLAHTLRRALWEAGVRTGEVAIGEASRALKFNRPSFATYFIEEVFGEIPEDVEARILLARSKAKSDPAGAHALLRDMAFDDVDKAILAIDLLREADELVVAEEYFTKANRMFPDEPRIFTRGARIRESLSDWDGAIELWTRVAEFSEDNRSRAKSEMVRLNLRMERVSSALANAAEHAAMQAPLIERLQIAHALEQEELYSALLANAARQELSGGAASTDWPRIAQILLDQGRIGLLFWLNARTIPIGNLAISILDSVKPDRKSLALAGGTVHQAAKLRSPDFLFPLDQFFDDAPIPGGRQSFDPKSGTVLLVNSTLAAGGAERQLVILVSALLKAGLSKNQIHVALFSAAKDRGHAHFLEQLQGLGVNVIVMRQYQALNTPFPEALRGPLSVLPTPLRNDVASLWQLATEIRPDVIHGWQDRAALAAGWVGSFQAIDRVVMSVRNMRPDKRGEAKLKLTRKLFRELCKYPNVVMSANAEPGARDYEKWLELRDGKLKVLCNGLDVGSFAGIARDRRKANDGSPIHIGGVFRLAANKRPVLWLQTIAELQKITDVPIIPHLIGNGPFLKDVLESKEALGLSDLTISHGLSAPAEIYGKLDMLLLMSRVEGTPNVVLEAQAAGLPVAACDVGGVRDALLSSGSSAGLILDAETSPRNAARAVSAWLMPALMADPEPRRHFVGSKYGTDKLAQQTLHLYSASQDDLLLEDTE